MELKHIPVLLYSSIITPDNHKKGQAVGADAQVAKPELNKVVQLADELISASIHDHRAEALREVATVAQTSIEDTAVSSEPASTEGASTQAEIAAETPRAVSPTSPAPVAPPNRCHPPLQLPPHQLPRHRRPPAQRWSPRPTLADDLQESPAPHGIDHRLWRTFHNELVVATRRSANLAGSLRQWRPSGQPDARTGPRAAYHQVGRDGDSAGSDHPMHAPCREPPGTPRAGSFLLAAGVAGGVSGIGSPPWSYRPTTTPKPHWPWVPSWQPD